MHDITAIQYSLKLWVWNGFHKEIRNSISSSKLRGCKTSNFCDCMQHTSHNHWRNVPSTIHGYTTPRTEQGSTTEDEWMPADLILPPPVHTQYHWFSCLKDFLNFNWPMWHQRLVLSCNMPVQINKQLNHSSPKRRWWAVNYMHGEAAAEMNYFRPGADLTVWSPWHIHVYYYMYTYILDYGFRF